MCWLVVWVAQVAPSCLSAPSSLTTSPNRPHHFNFRDRRESLSTPAILTTSWKSVCRECRMCQEMTRCRPWRATYDQCPEALAMSNLNNWKTRSIIMFSWSVDKQNICNENILIFNKSKIYFSSKKGFLNNRLHTKLIILQISQCLREISHPVISYPDKVIFLCLRLSFPKSITSRTRIKQVNN